MSYPTRDPHSGIGGKANGAPADTVALPAFSMRAEAAQ